MENNLSNQKADLNNDGVVSTKEEKLYIENWTNRRKMAWIALWAIIIVIGLLLFMPIPETRLTIINEPLVWFFLSMASIVGAYMGFSTWASKK